MSFVTSDNNTAAIEELFKSNCKLKCAVAFWGADAEKLITTEHESIQIICNLESGATNPYLIEKLSKKSNIKIKTNKKLHAKVYLAGDKSAYKRAIVGSANASANGLSYEESELNGWIEAGIVVENEETLSEINNWFKEQWDNADDITDELIEEAKIKWKKKRSSRNPDFQTNKSLLDNLRDNPEQFKDRNIFISICRIERLSPEAEDTFYKVQDELKIKKQIDCFEDFGLLSEHEDDQFISLYLGLNNGVKFWNYYYVSSPIIEEPFQDEDGNESNIQIIFLRKNIERMTLSKEDKSMLRKGKEESIVKKLWLHKAKDPQDKTEAIVISLFEAGKIIFPK